MALGQSDLDRIEAAIANGRLTVQFEGRSETYRSMDDLIKARDLIKQSMNQQSGTERSRYSLAAFYKD